MSGERTQTRTDRHARSEVGVRARGRGRFRFWIGGYTKSGQPATVDFKKYNNLTNEWKHYKVSWTPQGGYPR